MKHTSKSSLYIISSLTITTIISGLILSSASVSADNDSVVDEINITVPVACTLSGTGMNTHNAEINNGQYNSAIGETTLKALCNDNNGFAIYAIGYTDNEDGKNVLTNSTLGNTYDIETGTAITGNDSQWAMKLSTITSPTPTYPIIIAGSTDDTEKAQGDPDYSVFQEVPDDYVLVAKRTSATDTGTNAEGTMLKSTYQAYISKTQPAGTYTGQVKYTLVHPASATSPTGPNQISVIYRVSAENYSFPDGSTENRVIYGDSYTPMHITTTPEIVETSNLTNGVQDGGYSDHEYLLETKTFNDAIKIKVEVDYNVTGNSARMIAFDGEWDGDWGYWNDTWESYGWIENGQNASGTKTYIIEGDTATIYAESWDTPESGYDYGFYAKVYPIYADAHEDTIPMQTKYYIADNPVVIKSSNINNDGTQNGPYSNNNEMLEPLSFPGAYQTKVFLRFGLTFDTAYIILAENEWSGWGEPPGDFFIIAPSDGDISGTRTLTFDNNTVTLAFFSRDVPKSDYDYGMYAEVYPIYDARQENTSPIIMNMSHSFGPQIGAYIDMSNAHSANWSLENGEEVLFFNGETEVIEYLEQNKDSLMGTTITLDYVPEYH